MRGEFYKDSLRSVEKGVSVRKKKSFTINMKLRSVLKDWFVAILCSSRKIPATALLTMEKKEHV